VSCPKACKKESLLSAAKMSVSAWPNPFRHESTITLEAEESGHAQVIVTDLQGRVVAELFNGHAEAGAPINLRFQPQERNGGTYLYRVSFGGEVTMGRIIAQP
jgi:hypothetical protein